MQNNLIALSEWSHDRPLFYGYLILFLIIWRINSLYWKRKMQKRPRCYTRHTAVAVDNSFETITANRNWIEQKMKLLNDLIFPEILLLFLFFVFTDICFSVFQRKLRHQLFKFLSRMYSYLWCAMIWCGRHVARHRLENDLHALRCDGGTLLLGSFIQLRLIQVPMTQIKFNLL